MDVRRARVLVAAAAAAALLSACSASAAPAPTAATATPWGYTSSYSTLLPDDLHALPVATCRPRAMDVSVENRAIGTAQWRSVDRGPRPAFPLYLDAASAVCGQSIGVHIAAFRPAQVVVRAFRIGWYHGRGARLVWSSRPALVSTPLPPPVPGRTMTSPGWPAQVTLPIGPAWPPGLYVVATEVGHRLSDAAGLVVRDPGRKPAAVVYSQLTWNAYTRFGGASLYEGPDGVSRTRAYEASLRRPLVASGVSALLDEDVPTAELLDRSGIAVDPLVDTDVDTWPSLLWQRVSVVVPGHSEYWTRRMYDALTAARNEGANIAELGGNEVYWHARVGYGPDGRADSMAVVRSAELDPAAADDPRAATVQWRALPLDRDPSAVLGQSYTAVRAHGGEQVVSVPTWLQGVRGLQVGAVLPRAAWGEVDGVWPGLYDYPPNLQAIAVGVLRQDDRIDKPAAITYYSSDSGGGVLDLGSSFWPCMTLGTCPGIASSASVQAQDWAITQAVLVDFQTPSWGRLHPSVATPLVPVDRLEQTLKPAAIGTSSDGD